MVPREFALSNESRFERACADNTSLYMALQVHCFSRPCHSMCKHRPQTNLPCSDCNLARRSLKSTAVFWDLFHCAALSQGGVSGSAKVVSGESPNLSPPLTTDGATQRHTKGRRGFLHIPHTTGVRRTPSPLKDQTTTTTEEGMPSPPRTNPRGYDVRFRVDTQEYPVFTEDPPVVVQGRYQPPPAPRLPAHSLPATPSLGTPETGFSTLHREDAHTEGSPTTDMGSADAGGGAGVDSASHPQTPAGSPARESSSMRSSPSSATTASPVAGSSTASSSSPPRSSSDLCRELQRFPLNWPVREMRFADMVRADFLRAHAFASGRKSCVLHFEGAHSSDSWDATVGPRKDGRSLTVEDVLARVDRELYKRDDGFGFYDAHPRVDDARNERRTRLYGEEDTLEDIFRGIDFFCGTEHLYFLGLVEVSSPTSGVRYEVRLGPV